MILWFCDTLKELTCLHLQCDLSGSQHTLWRAHELITCELILLLLPLFLESILHLARNSHCLPASSHFCFYLSRGESLFPNKPCRMGRGGKKMMRKKNIESDKYDWELRCKEFRYLERCLRRYIPTSLQANKISTYYWECYASVEGPNYISHCSEDSCNIHTSLMWNFIPYL